MNVEKSGKEKIRKLQNITEAKICAQMMANSEPWITLRRDYEASFKILTDPAKEVYLVTVDGDIAGFTILNMHGAFVGYIQSMCVVPEWRNRGLGSRLMAFIEKRIFSETPNAFICVSSFNEGAQILYERLGYEVVGELKDYIISGHSEILLRKTIAPLSEYPQGMTS
jgi:ribosomal protein S18 acetylase RimI-like enzyme